MKKFDPAWLDRMYNNRALVPEHAMHFVRWADASDDARHAHPCQTDIAYGKGPMEKLDVFPSNQPGSPVVVFIHGGWWRALDKSDHSFIAPAFKNLGGCVFIPNYALCPAVTIPQITLQMVQALAWVYRNAKKFGGDPRRIYVVGHSAGGHLAAMLLDCLWPQVGKDLPADLVKGALSISGLYDLEPIMHTPFLKGDLRLTPEQVAMASPALLPAPKKGVLYTVAGAQESAEFIRHNKLIQQAWGKQVVPVCETIPERNHFSVLEDLTAPWQHLHQLAIRLVFGKV
ncbi:alpha/beta hydrolase [Rhodoferax sp. BAB1]|uniref:alpha/beta hydrolase n=1 Tax=Rhodoferax sp. BAB1 TaxID=2741720 RepID=UPI0015753653|nr:alpha/beta hydrolase [Rhodoferax sp. BAB1]QKO21095.1 alpha/beta hydrolase [Rhodoferax sp. BAB1]